MMDTSKPVIVVVNGPAYGGGAELAALGDLVIATPNARFAQPEIKLGAFPPLAAAVLPYILGPKMAMELVLTGEAMTAERAREVGLVNLLVPEDKLVDKVDEMVGEGDGAVGSRVDHGEESDSGQPGIAAARRRAQFDESFPERAGRPGRFAGRFARAGGKTRAEVEEPLSVCTTWSGCSPSLTDALAAIRSSAITNLKRLFSCEANPMD